MLKISLKCIISNYKKAQKHLKKQNKTTESVK